MTTTIDTAKIRHENSADIVTHRLVRDLCDALDEAQARVMRVALSAASDLCDAADDLDAERAKVARLRVYVAGAMTVLRDGGYAGTADFCATILAETAPKEGA